LSICALRPLSARPARAAMPDDPSMRSLMARAMTSAFVRRRGFPSGPFGTRSLSAILHCSYPNVLELAAADQRRAQLPRLDQLDPLLQRKVRGQLARGERALHRGDDGLLPLVEDIGDQRLSVLAERSEEHTSELQSRENLVCRLLLEKKK